MTDINKPLTLSDVLRGGRQCDEDGVEIIMSRQACCEAADTIDRLTLDCEKFANQTFKAKAEAKTLVDHTNAERDALAVKLKLIADLDPEVDSDDGLNEWGQAHCFELAQAIAKDKS